MSKIWFFGVEMLFVRVRKIDIYICVYEFSNIKIIRYLSYINLGKSDDR